jgi:hypothetical protein
MLVLGIVLILIAAGSFVAVLASGTDDHAVLYGGSVQMPTLVVFLAGALALLIIVLGVELVRSGIRRANQNRQTKKRLRKLEKREQLRREQAGSEGQAAGPETTEHPPADTQSGSQANTPLDPAAGTRTDVPPHTHPGDPQRGSGTETGPGAGTGTSGGTPVESPPGTIGESGGHAPTDGPYQAPPPPSR